MEMDSRGVSSVQAGTPRSIGWAPPPCPCMAIRSPGQKDRKWENGEP
eukprot:CAMPEP_0174732112 /NCGR_PEP_ID=MMETSP1094-20130205/58819_1 /TAXON_ID=156173 /ORGANISM="Chrysochromulina brevifilum, Strain UTEX LB 985" /LENGTH=46 /DNA_ID= /DNA_START= /DNA_END= /DNA_ORIENTATION=